MAVGPGWGKGMALPATLFAQAAPYAAWEYWVHLLSGGAVALAAAAAVVWVVRYLWPAATGASGHVARALLLVALAAVASALWVVGTPPGLVVRPQALATDMANALSTAQAKGSDPPVTAPAWAQTAAADLLTNYAAYLEGRYVPPMPKGMRLALVMAPPVASLSGLLDHGDSAPIPNLARQALATLLAQIPVSTQSEIAAAGGASVGAAGGTAITKNRRTNVLLIAIFVQSHG